MLEKWWRPGPESNRRARICSPLRHHSATGPSGCRRVRRRGRAFDTGATAGPQLRIYTIVIAWPTGGSPPRVRIFGHAISRPPACDLLAIVHHGQRVFGRHLDLGAFEPKSMAGAIGAAAAVASVRHDRLSGVARDA